MTANFKLFDRGTRQAAWKKSVGVAGLTEYVNKKIAAAGYAGNDMGLGAVGGNGVPVGLASCCDMITTAKNCPSYLTPIYDQVLWDFQGPVSQTALTDTFGMQIDLFGSGKSPIGPVNVQSSFSGSPGRSQTPVLITGVFFHIVTEPMCFTAKGNSVTRLTGGVPAVQKPISPDFYVQSDQQAATNTLGLQAGQTMLPAVMEHGWWTNQAAWHMVNAYNFTWNFGRQTTIFNDLLRYRAYTPQNAQPDSASSSEVDIDYFVNVMNNYYDQVQGLNTSANFLKLDAIRLGISNKLGAGASFGSLFRPSRAFETVPVTFGGGSFKNMMKGNSEVAMLKIPTIFKAGVDYGLILNEVNNAQGNSMRQFLAADPFNSGTVPPAFMDDPAYLSGSTGSGTATTGITVAPSAVGTTSSMAEYSLDSTQTLLSSGVLSQRVIYKSGYLKLLMGTVGFELTDDELGSMCSDANVKAAIEGQCGCQFM